MSPADVRAIKRKQYGQVKTTGVMPKYRIGSLIGTDKSNRKVNPRKVDVREVRQHFDYNHQVTQNQVAMFGFSDAGSVDQQLYIGCLALANMIYRRTGSFATHPDISVDNLHTEASALNNVRMSLYGIYLGFENVTPDGITTHASVNVPIGTKLSELATNLKNSITTQQGNGRWPCTLLLTKVTKINLAEEERYAYYDLSNVMLHFNALVKYKYQNITPSTGVEGESSINDVSANPLSGRVYQFKGPAPRLRATVKDAEVNYPLDDLAKIEDITADSGQGTLACEAFRAGALYGGALKPGFHQPFRGVGVFTNITHEDKVYMPPGGYKQMIKKTAAKMSFKRFVVATVLRPGVGSAGSYTGLGANQIRVNRLGTCTMWAMEPTVRTDSNETVKLIVNRELYYTAKAVPGAKKQPVRSTTTVANGADFGA